MAYKNSKMNGKKSYGYKQGNMMPKVDDYSKPEACYAQRFDQAPLNYVERNNYLQKHEASKLRSEAHKGRYDK